MLEAELYEYVLAEAEIYRAAPPVAPEGRVWAYPALLVVQQTFASVCVDIHEIVHFAPISSALRSFMPPQSRVSELMPPARLSFGVSEAA